MSADIVAVLVVPAEGDPGGRLACLPWAYSPPAVASLVQPYCTPVEPVEPEWRLGLISGSDLRALPLWWDGALVPEGWDRLMRRYSAARDEAGEWPMLDDVLATASDLVAAGLASRVVRLARVEGRLVEVSP